MNAPRVWADVDLAALEHNLGVVRRRAGRAVALVLVVKADAYGHGAVEVSRQALRAGASALGVGTSAEALELRAAEIDAPILVLGTVVDAEVDDLLHHRIEVGLHSFDRLRSLDRAAARAGARARVHVNVDTGMGRLGVLPERAIELLRAVRAAGHVELAGLMTHATSAAGALDPATAGQMDRFEPVLRAAREEGLLEGGVHVANSACLFSGLAPLHDAVRVGLAAYGSLPSPLLQGRDELRPVLSLRSQIVFLKDLPAGVRVGYGGTFLTGRPTRLATLPLGYADGLPPRLAERGSVLLRGRRAPVRGKVTMDYTTIDVTDVPGARVGDTVTLFGRDGALELGVEEVAQACDTVPHQVLCAMGRRIERRYAGREPALAAGGRGA